MFLSFILPFIMSWNLSYYMNLCPPEALYSPLAMLPSFFRPFIMNCNMSYTWIRAPFKHYYHLTSRRYWLSVPLDNISLCVMFFSCIFCLVFVHVCKRKMSFRGKKGSKFTPQNLVNTQHSGNNVFNHGGLILLFSYGEREGGCFEKKEWIKDNVLSVFSV